MPGFEAAIYHCNTKNLHVPLKMFPANKCKKDLSTRNNKLIIKGNLYSHIENDIQAKERLAVESDIFQDFFGINLSSQFSECHLL